MSSASEEAPAAGFAVAPTTASAVEAAPTATSKRIKTFKNGYPIPAKKVEKWKLSKRELAEVAKAKRWASTPKSRSVIRCESGFDYNMVDGPYKGAWQFLTGNMKQGGIGEDAIVSLLGQFQTKELLLKNFTTGIATSHIAKDCAAIQTHRPVAQ